MTKWFVYVRQSCIFILCPDSEMTINAVPLLFIVLLPTPLSLPLHSFLGFFSPSVAFPSDLVRLGVVLHSHCPVLYSSLMSALSPREVDWNTCSSSPHCRWWRQWLQAWDHIQGVLQRPAETGAHTGRAETTECYQGLASDGERINTSVDHGEEGSCEKVEKYKGWGGDSDLFQ